MRYVDGYRELVSAIILQAVKDYFTSNEKNKKAILKDLRSAWLDWISDGLSNKAANKLETHPIEIRSRLKKVTKGMM